MQVDETNKKNIVTFLAYIGLIVLCVLALLVITFFAGTASIATTYGSHDRPTSTIQFHDHRL